MDNGLDKRIHEIFHVIMTVHLDLGAAESTAKDETGVIELIGQNQRARAAHSPVFSEKPK